MDKYFDSGDWRVLFFEDNLITRDRRFTLPIHFVLKISFSKFDLLSLPYFPTEKMRTKNLKLKKKTIIYLFFLWNSKFHDHSGRSSAKNQERP